MESGWPAEGPRVGGVCAGPYLHNYEPSYALAPLRVGLPAEAPRVGGGGAGLYPHNYETSCSLAPFRVGVVRACTSTIMRHPVRLPPLGSACPPKRLA
jgi:hypothetical protein